MLNTYAGSFTGVFANTVVVGIGEGGFSDNRHEVIKTYALGSCVAITGYSALRNVGGLIHCVLPNKSGHGSDHAKPWFYVEDAIPMFFQRMKMRYGCDARELEVKLFGGAKSINGSDIFNIGHKNVVAAKKILQAMNIKIAYSDVSGYYSRTVELDMRTGETNVLSYPISV